MSDLFDAKPSPGKTDTSDQAAEELIPEIRGLRLNVLAAISLEPQKGLTTEEIAEYVDRYEGTIQPRTSELSKWKLIEDSGFRRKNSREKMVIVWRITENGRKTLKSI